MRRHPVLSCLLVIGVLAFGAAAVPAGAITVGPASPPVSILTRTTTVVVPVTCTFTSPDSPSSVTHHNSLTVTVTAPVLAFPGVPYSATFHAVLPVTPGFAIHDWSTTAGFVLAGHVTPKQAANTTPFQDVPQGGVPSQPAFTRSFTAGVGGGTITYSFTLFNYAFDITGPMQVNCSLDHGPAAMGSTTIAG